MDQVSEFLGHADECLQMAHKERNEAVRERLMELARQWTLLAAAREQYLTSREQAAEKVDG